MGGLTSAFNAIANTLTQSLTRITGMFNRVWTLLKKPLSKITSFLRNIIAKLLKKPTDRSDYFSMGDKLVSKRLVFFVVVALVVGSYFFLKVGLPWLEGKLWTVDLNIGSEKYKSFSGKARVYSLENILIFEGNMSEGKMEGDGTQYDAAGNLVYKGNFEKSKYSGQGERYQDNVKIYEGEFVGGLYEGEGTLYNIAGEVEYTGNFVKGEKSGEGVEYDVNTGNMLYSGSFVLGQRDGEGVEYFATESEDVKPNMKYEGSFKEGIYDGSGKLYYESKAVRYIGEFKDGKFSGNGTEYADDSGNLVYSGEFKNDQYEGKGTLYSTTHKNIKEYYGEFQNGKKNGTGTSYDLLGSVSFEGKYTNGEIAYVDYLGKDVDAIIDDFKKPSNDDYNETKDIRYLTYANLNMCMIFVKSEDDDGVKEKQVKVDDNTTVTKEAGSQYNLQRVIMGFNHSPYQLTSDSTEEEISQKLGMDLFVSSTIKFNDMYKMAFSKIASTLAGASQTQALKYISSDQKYFIRIYKSMDGKRLEAIEVANASTAS